MAVTSGDALCDLSLAEVADLLRDRQVSAVELTDTVLRRIERYEPHLNSYLLLLPDHAREQARRADAERRAGRYPGPLHGVPLGLKDFFDVAGVPTTCGSRVLARGVAARDATVVTRLRAAGAVLLGKHNMDELGMGSSNDNPHFGRARNPWNTARSPGGSSGGSAAAVAAGLGFAALGTDTGCSVRVPAAACGLVGLKPTAGRVSRTGVGRMSWSLDHVGPITRTVRDSAIVLGAIAGGDPADPFSSAEAVPDYAAALSGDVRGLRIGLPQEHFFERLEPGVGEALRAAVDDLVALGARADTVSLPWARDLGPVGGILGRAETAACYRSRLAELTAEGVPTVLERIYAGLILPAEAYVTAQRARRQLQARARELFQCVDLLATPVWPYLPLEFDCPTVRLDGRDYPFAPEAIRFTMPFSVLGLPALALPCGFGPHGLPYSVQLVGRPFEETTVLNAAFAYEQAHAWHTRRPTPAAPG